MGLDIYLRYGKLEKDEEGYEYFVGWERGGEYEAEYVAQVSSGFTSAPESGYIRESWPSLRWVRETAQKFSTPFPYDFFPEWEGWNGETLRVDAERMPLITAFKSGMSEWLNSPERKKERSALSGSEAEHFDVLSKRIMDAIAFLSLVEQKKDEPNLTIMFM
jgi:hypothetical protein